MTSPPRCSRCNRTDYGAALDPDGLCWVCRSDSDERKHEVRSVHASDEAGGPALSDLLVAGRAALVECAPAPTPSSPGAGAAASPADQSPPAGRSGGAALDGGLRSRLVTEAYVAGGNACIEDERLGQSAREGPEDPELRVWWCRGYSAMHVTGATVRLAQERDALAEQTARLHAFADEWYAAAGNYERRLGCTRSPWTSDEPTPLEAERDALRARVDGLEAEREDGVDLREARDRAREALDEVRVVSDRYQLDAARLRAHVERLHRLLDHVCNRLDVTDLPTAVRLVEEVGAALASTPAASLEDHDCGVVESLITRLLGRADDAARIGDYEYEERAVRAAWSVLAVLPVVTDADRDTERVSRMESLWERAEALRGLTDLRSRDAIERGEP